MARFDSEMPPPSRGMDRGVPGMAAGPSPSPSAGMLAQLAGRQGGGGGGDQEAAQLVMSSAQQLMQAAQMSPALAPFIQQAIEVIRGGVEQLASGGPTPPEMRKPPKTPKKPKKPKEEEMPEEEPGAEDMGY